MAPMSAGSWFAPCWSPAAPNPLSGALCALLSIGVVLLPLWLVLPPTRRAVEQDAHQLAWDRPAWPTAVRVCGTMFLLLMLGSVTSALQDYGIDWSPVQGQDCSIAPPDVQALLQGRRDLLLLWSAAAGLGALSLAFWASSALRPTGRIRLDERGLELDGERWSFKDIVAAEVHEGQLRIERYDAVRYEVRLFRGEQAFARALVDRVKAHLPTDAEDRADARAALAELAEGT